MFFDRDALYELDVTYIACRRLDELEHVSIQAQQVPSDVVVAVQVRGRPAASMYSAEDLFFLAIAQSYLRE